jgi:hypothetical protein
MLDCIIHHQLQHTRLSSKPQLHDIIGTAAAASAFPAAAAPCGGSITDWCSLPQQLLPPQSTNILIAAALFTAFPSFLKRSPLHCSG